MYRTCRDMRYRTRPIHTPLQTRLHAACRGKIPASPRKVPSRKGNSAPDVGPSSPTPRRHSVISPALRFWDTRHDSPHACGLSNTRPKSRARRDYSRSWRPRAKVLVAKGESHDALGWRRGVGLHEKYSRPPASLFFGADSGGGVLDRESLLGRPSR
jgi:hypothetical protein